MIRVAVVDHHPAMRAGLEAILGPPPDAQVVASAGAIDEVSHMLCETAPDLVIVEDAGLGISGIEVCRRIKEHALAPKVLVQADRPDPVLVVAAVLAEADGVLDSGAPARELLEAVRTVARGERAFPDLDATARTEVAQTLADEDRGILAMRLAATPAPEIADTLGLDPRALHRRTASIIDRLRGRAAAGLSAAGRPLHDATSAPAY